MIMMMILLRFFLQRTHTHTKEEPNFFVGRMNGNIIGLYGEEERDCCVDCIDCVKSKSVSRRRRQEKKDFLGVVSSKFFVFKFFISFEF